MNPPASSPVFTGIDIGGTFTDMVVFRNNSLEILKTFTTQYKPALREYIMLFAVCWEIISPQIRDISGP
ncbi:MAG: hydantoinase/oxoprolinase N-terminal domain-containing protein [Vulcanimicrobiota bacterium]